jgi:hypothetical protein
MSYGYFSILMRIMIYCLLQSMNSYQNGGCADCCPEGCHDLWRLCGSSEESHRQVGWYSYFEPMSLDMSMHAKLYQVMYGFIG